MSSIKPVFFVRNANPISKIHRVSDLYYVLIEFTDNYYEEKYENNTIFLTFKPLAYIDTYLLVLNSGRYLIKLKGISYGRSNITTHLNLNILKRIDKIFKSREDIRRMLEVMKRENEKEYYFLFNGWNIKKYGHFSKQLLTYISENKYPVDIFYLLVG